MVEKLYEKPEIYRIFIPLPDNPLKNLNCYVIHSGDEYLMIDTGFNRPECKEAMEAGLGELAIPFDKLKLFLSHLHGDHTGLVSYFTANGVIPYMGQMDYEYLQGSISGDNWARMSLLFGVNGFPQDELDKQAYGNQARNYSPKEKFPVQFVKDGDVITVGDVSLRCIHVPGHTPGQICLYMEEEKIFFSADHVLFDITPNISVWLNSNCSLKNYLASLEKVAALEIVKTFPGHREFAGNIYDRIKALKKHHHDRLQEILSDVAAHEGCKPYETAGRIAWSARGRAWSQFSPNQRWFAMGETLAHLEWLLAEGYVRKDAENHYYTVRQRLDDWN